MTRDRFIYACAECGYETSKWMGRCPECGGWNTFQEIRMQTASKDFSKRGSLGLSSSAASKPVPLSSIENGEEERFSSGSTELDRVLGGGIVKGSLILIGGSPGIGKSTLLLQVSERVSRERGQVLYVSGEESLSQIKIRARRIGASSPYLFLTVEREINRICDQVAELSPALVVVDSIQAVYDAGVESYPGSVSQIRQCCGVLLQCVKDLNIPVFLVGHVTKGGAIAGPKMLEHMVDVVLYFEGDIYHMYRIIRAEKNRFGPTNEIGAFEMRDVGLVDVPEPSKIFLAERPHRAVGSQVVATLRGSRPIFMEIQSLVTESPFGNPRRLASGIDLSRLLLMLAILEKKAGLCLSKEDAYVNIAGGLKVDEPAVDLGLCISLASSFRNKEVCSRTFTFGEVGLAGEVRAVSQPELRIREGRKLGFKRCILPAKTAKQLGEMPDMDLIGVETVGEALECALEV